MIVTDKEGQFPVIWQWLHARTNLAWSTDLRVIGYEDEKGTIQMATGFNCWWSGGVFMHTATDRALRRDYVRAVFEYGFSHRDVLYGLTPNALERAHRLNRKLGFRKLIEIGGAVLYALEAADAKKWLLDAGRAISQDPEPVALARPDGDKSRRSDHGLSVALDEVRHAITS